MERKEMKKYGEKNWQKGEKARSEGWVNRCDREFVGDTRARPSLSGNLRHAFEKGVFPMRDY